MIFFLLWTPYFKLQLGISSPIIELIKSVNHEADENSPIGQIALAVTFKGPFTAKLWPTLFKISHRSEKIRKMIASTVQADEASEKVLCNRLSEIASGRVSAVLIEIQSQVQITEWFYFRDFGQNNGILSIPLFYDFRPKTFQRGKTPYKFTILFLKRSIMLY